METASTHESAPTSSARELPTVPQLVRSHILAAYDHTSLTPKKLTVAIIRDYTAHVPEHAGRLPIRDFDAKGEDFDALMDRRIAFVKQMVDPESSRHVPAEILPTLCRVLPAPYGESLRHSIARQIGCQGVDKISTDTANDIASIGQVLERVGDVAKRFAPLAADGVLDPRDARDAPAAIEACDEAIAALIGLQKLIETRVKLRAVA